MKNQSRVAVILAGCGHLDGSEIREAVGVLWALSEQGVTHVQCFAPKKDQADVMNHLERKPIPGATRNILEESARIARGKVLALNELRAQDFDALILPGGFGAAKNLATFAFKGASGTVDPEAQRVITSFYESKKPIGAVCIAPAIVGLALREKSLKLTVGKPGEASQEIEKMGHTHVSCFSHDCVVDPVNRVVTTPAYMFDDAPLSEIFQGIQKLVIETLKWSHQTKP